MRIAGLALWVYSALSTPCFADEPKLKEAERAYFKVTFEAKGHLKVVLDANGKAKDVRFEGAEPLKRSLSLLSPSLVSWQPSVFGLRLNGDKKLFDDLIALNGEEVLLSGHAQLWKSPPDKLDAVQEGMTFIITAVRRAGASKSP